MERNANDRTLADVGAGTGPIDVFIAEKVGSTSLVYAIDLHREMPDILYGKVSQDRDLVLAKRVFHESPS